MNILYLSIDGISDPLGQSQILPYLEGLDKQGYNIHLLTLEKKDKFQNLSAHLYNILKYTSIQWYPLTYIKKPPYIASFFNYLSFYKKAYKILRDHKIKIIHARSYLPALLALSIKKRYGNSFLFDMRGFWPDERVEGGIWNKNNIIHYLLYRFFKKKEARFIYYADHIISLTYEGKKILEKKYDQYVFDKISVIPCCVNLNLFDNKNFNEKNKNLIRKNLGIDDDMLILGYIGSIGTWYMLNEMLTFFKYLKRNYKKAKFLFLTFDKDRIEKTAKKNNIDLSDLIITNAAHSKIPDYINIIDLGILFIKPVFSKKASSPTKLAEFLSMGIPVITNSGVGDNNYIMEQYQPGYSLKDFSEEEYKKAAGKVDEIMKIPATKIRQAAENYFSLENGIQKYQSIYRELAFEK